MNANLPRSSTSRPPLRYSTAAGRWVIAATVLGSSVAALDSSVVSIALPTIGREFRVGVADLQWVSTGYMLTLAGLLLLAGALGDRLGRKKVFLVGVVWFGLASLLCAVAPNILTLILARALQGVGGALLTPGSLAIIEASFQPDDLSWAIGAWSGLGWVATAIGPFVGGYLIAAASWRFIFLINVPLVAAVVLISLRHVPESHDVTASGRLDLPGTALAMVGLSGLCYGLIEGPGRGFSSPIVLIALLWGVCGLGLFLVVEARTAHPLLPLQLFATGQFCGANVVTLVVYGALGGVLFLLPIQLQEVAHYSPLESGLALLPITFIMLLLSSRSGALAARIGPRLLITAGPAVMAVGMILLARSTSPGGYLIAVLPGMLVLALGLAATVAPLTATVLAAAPAQEADVTSAVNNSVGRTAGLLAIAVLAAAAGINGDSYLYPARFAEGFRNAIFICAGLCFLGALVAAVNIGNPRQRPAVRLAAEKTSDQRPPRHLRRTIPSSHDPATSQPKDQQTRWSQTDDR